MPTDPAAPSGGPFPPPLRTRVVYEPNHSIPKIVLVVESLVHGEWVRCRSLCFPAAMGAIVAADILAAWRANPPPPRRAREAKSCTGDP